MEVKPDTTSSWVARLPASLCGACVGRVFARTAPAASNAERGRVLRPEAPPPSAACPLCEGLTTRFDAWRDLCLQAVEGYEYDSFLVGSVLFRSVRQREDALYEQLAVVSGLRGISKEGEGSSPAFAPAEYLKSEINREVGKRLERATGRTVDFARPHIVFQIDTRFDHVALRVAGLFVRGRYRKHDRTLPQTRWPCRFCNGPGCRRCAFRGRTYEQSVEQLVAAPFLEAAGGADEAFHGMGREDIDALMLGSGRPFVLEIKAPRRRSLDLTALAEQVARRSGGRVEALGMAPSDAGAPARYKDADADKTYRARCRAQAAIPPGKLISIMPSLRDLRLDQRTPERVSHRRADLVRARTIHEVRLLGDEGDRFELEIRAESGTYIKEFVSGDQGRTRPNLSDVLGVPCRVEELDVIDVAWKE